MAFFDLPLDQLQTYLPPLTAPDDFDDFWAATLAAARQHPLDAQFVPAPGWGITAFDLFDVTFNGYGGQPIKGWFWLPKGAAEPLPCVVEYIGYGGGRGLPYQWMAWAAAGYAYFIMDTRGQGMWARGDTADVPEDYRPHTAGMMTQGILDPERYYYRRVFTDAVRAVEAARSHSGVDASRVAVTGGSQGGAITIAAAGLVPDLVAALPDVPFLCHFDRVLTLVDKDPYYEISRYLAVYREHEDQVYRTLSYFDGMNFAARSAVPALYSVGLMDMVCPPSTVFAAYNHLNAPKEIHAYRFNQHEGGGWDHFPIKLKYLNGIVGKV